MENAHSLHTNSILSIVNQSSASTVVFTTHNAWWSVTCMFDALSNEIHAFAKKYTCGNLTLKWSCITLLNNFIISFSKKWSLANTIHGMYMKL